MVSPELPYDILLRIFKELADPNADIEGETACWLVLSSSAELLSCSLVSSAWRLPAQHMLWRCIRFDKLRAVTLFLRTAAVRPDLARQTLLLTFYGGVEDEGSGSPEDDKRMILSTLFLAALVACPNVRTLYAHRLDEMVQPGFELVVTTLQHLETWGGDTSIKTSFSLLEGTNSLRRLELRHPRQWTMSPLPSLPSSPVHLTTLHVEAGPSSPVLALVKAVGPTLQQLSVRLQGLISPQEGRASFATTTSSLRHLRLDLYLSGDEMGRQEKKWFEDLLPQFTRLERLLISPFMISEATVLGKLPPTLRWMELSAYGVPTVGLLKELSASLPAGTNTFPLRQLVVTHCHLPFSADEVARATSTFRAKGVDVEVESASSETVDVFDSA